MNENKRRMIPPDGGWGWVAVLGASLVNMSTRAIEPSFGLLFGDLLRDLGVETTGASVIMSTLDAMINFSGLLVGPLIRIYSYRKIAVLGSFLSAAGLILTFNATSMTHILITYCILGGVGVGLATSSAFVSLNHYFLKYRGQAVGLSLAGTAVGFLIMPHVVRLLLDFYNFRGTVLILGALALHSVVGSTLFQPAKWHFIAAKEVDIEGEYKEDNVQTRQDKEDNVEANSLIKKCTKAEIPEADSSNYNRNLQIPRITSSSSIASKKRRESVISSISSMDFHNSCLHLQAALDINESKQSKQEMCSKDSNDNNSGEEKEKKKKKKTGLVFLFQFVKRVSDFMDFDLFKDVIYLNIIFGLSVFYVSELNYKMIVPFFLRNMGYNNADIAFCLSMTAIADFAARVIFPPICDRVNFRKRTLFLISSVFLCVSRSYLAEQTEEVPLMIALVANGFFRGSTLINLTLTISEHCTLEKLPAGFGLHMVVRGIFISAIGPLLGFIRDVSESYPLCIHSQTFLIVICIVAWSIEYLTLQIRQRNS